MTLELMGVMAADRPKEMRFLGARRTQAGAVVYTLDAPASENYLRKDDMMTAFMNHFGDTSALRARAYQIVVEHVPITFDTASADARKRIDGASGLLPMAVSI